MARHLIPGPSRAVRFSRGSRHVAYAERWEKNVLPPPVGQDWPASLLKQVSAYRARADWFTPEDAEALSAHTGYISKMQSLRSEDAITWSWFGTLALGAPEAKQAVLSWLYARIGLELSASEDPIVDQWPRVFHPNSPGSPNGPELDARIDDSGAVLVYVEAKWEAAIGTGKGAEDGDRDDQVVLRRDSMRKDPSLRGDKRSFVVLGISNAVPDLTPYSEPHRAVLASVQSLSLG